MVVYFMLVWVKEPSVTIGGQCGEECHGARYKIHFYCLAVEAPFYSDVVECLPVDPASWVRFPAGTGKIFSLYDNLHSLRCNIAKYTLQSI